MSESRNKLALLAEKKEKLEVEFQNAIAEKKPKIGALAEKCNVLYESDDFFIGLFLDAADKLKNDDTYRKNIESIGATFLNKQKKDVKDKKALKETPVEVEMAESLLV